MALSQALHFEHAAAIGSASARLLQAILSQDLPERDRALVAIAEAVLAFQILLDSKPAADSKGKAAADSAGSTSKNGQIKRAPPAENRPSKVSVCDVRWHGERPLEVQSQR